MHFLRNVLAAVPKGPRRWSPAAIRTIFAQPDDAHVREQLEVIAAMLGRQLPKVEAMLRDADRDHRVHRLPDRALEEDLVHQPRAPRGAVEPRGGESPSLSGCRSSLTSWGQPGPEVRVRVGAAPTTTGRVGTVSRPGPVKRDGQVYVCRNQWWNPRKWNAGSNLTDRGRSAVHTSMACLSA